MENREDIFDQLMKLPALRLFEPLYRQYKEPLLYLFFGGLTTLLSIVLFWLFTQPMQMGTLMGNAVAWVICVLFAYVTNRTWVFAQKACTRAGVLQECSAFVAGRVGTLVLEEAVLWLGIEALGMNSMAVKVFAQVLVVVGNYFISKIFVFTDKR